MAESCNKPVKERPYTTTVRNSFIIIHKMERNKGITKWVVGICAGATRLEIPCSLILGTTYWKD